MPTPRQLDQPPPVYLLMCPHCIQVMRIKTIELGDGRQRTTLVCDKCKGEALKERPI
jgi:hypothetical protein